MNERAEDAWAERKAAHVAESYVANLASGRLNVANEVRVRWGHFFRGTTVYVLASGHTLPDDLSFIDGPSIALNSSLRAVLRRNDVPSFVLCRESIDMSACFEKCDTTPIFDACVSPKTWESAAALTLPATWFYAAQLQMNDHAALAGVRPFYAGQSAMTAAVAIATECGAERVVLVGGSLAFEQGTGKAYASGSLWEAERLESVESDGPHLLGRIVGREAKAEMHKASGQAPPLEREIVVKVPLVDGSIGYAVEPVMASKTWLERYAARHPEVEFVQHGADVALSGWSGRAVEAEPTIPDTRLAALRNQAHQIELAANAVLDTDRVATVGATISGPILMHTAAEHVRLKRLPQDPLRLIPRRMKALVESATKVAAMLPEE